jgi:hypothetical protein
MIRKLARYVSQNSQGQLDFRKSDRLIACRCVRLAAARANAAEGTALGSGRLGDNCGVGAVEDKITLIRKHTGLTVAPIYFLFVAVFLRINESSAGC